MSDTSPALEVSWGAAILFASVTVVVWAIGLRAYDPYRDRRHSPD